MIFIQIGIQRPTKGSSSTSTLQQQQQEKTNHELFERLQNKPFWIWNIENI
jgi:hypothetical protein